MSNDKLSFPKQESVTLSVLSADEWWASISRMWQWMTIEICVIPVFWPLSLLCPGTCLPDFKLGTKAKRLNFSAFPGHSKRMTFRTFWMKIIFFFAENWCVFKNLLKSKKKKNLKIYWFVFKKVLAISSHLRFVSRKDLVSRMPQYSRNIGDD